MLSQNKQRYVGLLGYLPDGCTAEPAPSTGYKRQPLPEMAVMPYSGIAWNTKPLFFPGHDYGKIYGYGIFESQHAGNPIIKVMADIPTLCGPEAIFVFRPGELKLFFKKERMEETS